jgi:hypothetical protein
MVCPTEQRSRNLKEIVQAGRFVKDIMQRGWQTTKDDGLPHEIVAGCEGLMGL